MENNFYLGVDWGKHKIGLAIADGQNKLATPITVVKTLDEVLKIIKQEDITDLVVGKPISLSGHDAKFTAGFSGFIEQLGKQTGLEINLMDERMTTKAANNLPGAKKVKAKEDAIAAMLILQSFLDKN